MSKINFMKELWGPSLDGSDFILPFVKDGKTVLKYADYGEEILIKEIDRMGKYGISAIIAWQEKTKTKVNVTLSDEDLHYSLCVDFTLRDWLKRHKSFNIVGG